MKNTELCDVITLFNETVLKTVDVASKCEQFPLFSSHSEETNQRSSISFRDADSCGEMNGRLCHEYTLFCAGAVVRVGCKSSTFICVLEFPFTQCHKK